MLNTYGIPRQWALAASLLASGNDINEIVPIVFNVRTETGGKDEKKVKRGRAKIREWMKDPRFKECYRECINELTIPLFGSAVKKLASQIDDTNQWLANKACNDIISRFGDAIMGTSDKEVTVRIEGMPAIGVPDDVQALPEAQPALEEGNDG